MQDRTGKEIPVQLIDSAATIDSASGELCISLINKDPEEAQEYYNDCVEESQEAKNTGELIGTVEVDGNRMTIQGYEKGNEEDGEMYGVMILDGNIVFAVTTFGASADTKALADQIIKECGY